MGLMVSREDIFFSNEVSNWITKYFPSGEPGGEIGNDHPQKASPAWLSGKGGLKPFAGSLFRAPCSKDC